MYTGLTRLSLLLLGLLSVPFAGMTQTNKDQASIDFFEKKIKFYRYSKPDSAVYFSQKGMEWANAHKDSIGIASMFVQMGLIDDNQGEFESSRSKYNNALDIFTLKNVPNKIASTSIRLGVVDLRNGRYDDAMKYFLKALGISEQLKDKSGIMEAYYSISWMYLDRKDYQSALLYLKKAEKLNDELPFSSTSLNIFNHLGVVYRETGRYQEAISYLEKGVKLSTDPANQGLNITLINNLASVYARQGLKAKALRLQEDALKRSREIGNYLRELQALSGISKTYGKENPEKAIYYLEQAIALARAKNAYNQEMRYLKVIIPMYLTLKNYEQAFVMKEREHALADSFYYRSISKNIESLRTEYELSKSNARIKELALITNRDKLELANARIIKNVTIAGAGLLLIILLLLYNHYRVKQRTASQLNEKNISLEKLVTEKELLLREIHHRVKNNLHTVMSLLETQSASLKDDALQAVQNSQHRVYAMSLIHQKLYQVEHAKSVDMSVYLPELVEYLKDSFDTGQRIRIRSHVDDVQLDLSKAIPVALILNEAITNSIKYAFPHNKQGEVHIELRKTITDKLKLSIRDNGIGLPDNWEEIQKNSLGLKLIRGLTEDLRGSFTIESSFGTKIIIEFPGSLVSQPSKGVTSNASFTLQS